MSVWLYSCWSIERAALPCLLSQYGRQFSDFPPPSHNTSFPFICPIAPTHLHCVLPFEGAATLCNSMRQSCPDAGFSAERAFSLWLQQKKRKKEKRYKIGGPWVTLFRRDLSALWNEIKMGGQRERETEGRRQAERLRWKSKRRNQQDWNEHLTMMKPHGSLLSLAS